MEILDRNVLEFAPDKGDFSYMKSLVENILKKKKDLDNIIEKAAPDWPVDKISVIDRNILRLGLFELLFGDKGEVPPKVAINEAIELAKTFGGETSGKFVNGVLGAVYKEMGEPGKDDTSKKIKNHDLPESELSIEKLAGAVVFAKDKGEVYLALVHDVFGHWTLSKGHLEDGEEEKVGCARVIKEELELDVKVGEKLGDNSYIAYDPEKGKIKKQVNYYLAEAPFSELKPPESGGLDDVRWFKLADILDLNFYDDILPIVTNAVNILLKK